MVLFPSAAIGMLLIVQATLSNLAGAICSGPEGSLFGPKAKGISCAAILELFQQTSKQAVYSVCILPT